MRFSITFEVDWITIGRKSTKEINFLQVAVFMDDLLYEKRYGLSLKILGFGLVFELKKR